ncbi:unnamed protein product, partial [Adineta steineri]
SIECEQDKIENKSTIDVNQSDSNSLKTLNTISIHTKSYNTSAYPKKFHQQHIKKRISRSPAEYGKHKHKRRRHTRFELRSKACISNRNVNYSFLNNLCLLYQNKKQKTMKKHNKKQKQFKSVKHININATKGNSSTTNLRNNLIIESTDDLSSLHAEQLQVYFENLIQTIEIPDQFQLTEEQLNQIIIEENIRIHDVDLNETSMNTFHLNEKQIQFLIAQIDMMNWLSLNSNFSFKQQQLPLILHLNQLIELCNQQHIDIDKLLNNQTDLQNSLSPVNSNFEFTFSASQIAYIINQHSFDMKKVLAIQQNLKKEDSQTQQFHLNISQLAYLFVNRHIMHSHEIVGLSASQLIALYMLQQSSIQDDQTSFFSLTYQQIKQLALMQNMSLEHLRALPISNKPLQLSHNQLTYIAMENKITIEQITSLHSSQKSKILTHKQLCTLINQSSQLTELKNSINLRQSTDEFSRIPQYICLN